MRNPIFNLKSLIFNLKFFIFNLQSLIFILSMLSVICNAQPTEEWVARFQRPPGIGLNGPFLALDRAGNSYIAGLTDSLGLTYIIVVKYNSSGNQQWASYYRHPNHNFYITEAIAADEGGNVYVTGVAASNSSSVWNTLTIKFNTLDGSVIWAKKYEYILGSHPFDITVDNLNYIYVVGSSSGAIMSIKYDSTGDSVWVRRYIVNGGVAWACTLDDSMNLITTGSASIGSGATNIFTLKYSSNGIFRWYAVYNGPGNGTDAGWEVTADQNGNIYVAGHTLEGAPWYDANYVTLKYNRDGIQQWASIYDGPGIGDNMPTGIAMDRVNNYVYVTGYSPGTNNLMDYATIKYNVLNGDSVWVRRYNGTNNNDDQANALQLDLIGNIYVTGRSVGASGGYNYVTIKYLPNGLMGWNVEYNGFSNRDDIATDLKIDTTGNVYITGGSQNLIGSVFDYVTIKYSQPLGIQITNQYPLEFKLFQNCPNPFNNNTKIGYNIKSTGNVKILVYDILGREISRLFDNKESSGYHEIIFDASNLASGVYYYKLITENFTDVKKMVLVK